MSIQILSYARPRIRPFILNFVGTLQYHLACLFCLLLKYIIFLILLTQQSHQQDLDLIRSFLARLPRQKYVKQVNFYNINIMIFRIAKRFCNKKPILSKQSVSQIISKTGEIEMSQQEIQKQMQLRVKQLQKRHRETQELIDSKIKFPIKICGTSDKYESRFGYLPDRIMSYYRIPRARITDYLIKMYKASLYSIADVNQSYMNEYWEEGFKKKTLEAIREAKEQNLVIKVEQDPNYLEEIQQSCEIIDSIMLRGLSFNRNQNKHPKQYLKYAESDEVGLITFTPKHITDNNQNFIDPAKNKVAYDGYDKMLLRLLCRIKSPLRLSIPQFNVPDEVYTWQHLCIFESQMVPPKPLESGYKLQTYMEWLGKYRFGPWKVADIDNFMLGNSPFQSHYKQQFKIDPIFKGTKLDKSHYIDIRMV